MRECISAYCYCNRGKQYDMPFLESIAAWADVCKTGKVVVVTDRRFKDGTFESLVAYSKHRTNVMVVEHEWNVNEPGCDGIEKAFARSIAADTVASILIPFDVDEIPHERDIPKLRRVAEQMVRGSARIVATGIFDWKNGKHINLSAPLYKPRLTLNDGALTHGIPKKHRRILENGKVYSSKESDGA